MRKNKLFAIAGLLAVFASPLLAKDGPGSAQDCWKPAFEASDADAVAQCYAPDAVLWLPGVPVMTGREAIREGHVGYFAAFKVKSITLTRMGHNAVGDDSATWGTFALVVVSKEDGKETTSTGRYTDVSRKIDGRWMYVVDHASDDPPPAPAK